MAVNSEGFLINKNGHTIFDLVELERRIDPLTAEEIELLTSRQEQEANRIITDNKYKKFAREFVRTGNARQSASNSGFHYRHGYRLLANEKVIKYINEISDLVTTGEIANTKETLLHLSDVIRGEIKDYAYTKDGEVFEMPVQVKDRVKALDIMTKCLGLQTQNLKVDGRIENINLTVDVDQQESILEVNAEDVEILDAEWINIDEMEAGE